MEIKIVTGFDGECPFRKQVQDNLAEYCERWGYTLVTKFDNWGPLARDVGWRKIELILSELSDCDWFLWLDADCMVVNMTIPLESFLGDDFDLAVTGPFAPCPSCSKPVFSAGVMLFRCCEWSQKFVQRWWESHDISWRQGALADCRWNVDNDWLSCCTLSDPEIVARVKKIPLDIMGHATYHHSPDQFLMHFYGSAGARKLEEFKFYNSRVIR